MKDFRIARAKIIDINKISLFLQKNFRIHNLRFNKKYVEKSLHEGIWFLSKRNNKLRGVIFLRIIKQDSRGEIKHLLVKEDYRGKGIGKALLNEAIKFAGKKKLRKLTGMVPSKNIKILKNFVKSFNFKLEGILKNHYRKNEDVYIYSLFFKKKTHS